MGFLIDLGEALSLSIGITRAFFAIKKLRDPFLPKYTEVETPQVTTVKLPRGTREHLLSAATFLS